MTLDQLINNSPEDDKTGRFEFKGKQITMLDLNGVQPEGTRERVEKAKTIIYASPHDSVLLLSDFRDLRYDKKTAEYAKQTSKSFKPFVTKSALLGIEGLKKIIFQAMLTFSGRKNMKPFSDVKEAMDWLTSD